MKGLARRSGFWQGVRGLGLRVLVRFRDSFGSRVSCLCLWVLLLFGASVLKSRVSRAFVSVLQKGL